MRRLLLLSSIILLLGACTKGEEENGNTDTPDNKAKTELTVTGDASNITELSAILSGYANPTPDMGNVTMGILYSTDEDPSLENSVKLTSKELDGNNKYTVSARDLASNTTYYYKSFIEYGGVYRSGEIKSFKTLAIYSTITTSSPTDVGMFAATMNGSIKVDSKGALEKDAWFLWAKGKLTIEQLKSDGAKVSSELTEAGAFSNTIKDLAYNAEYSYVACAKIHDKEVYGEVISFSTNDINATVVTGEASNVGLFTATLSGVLNVSNKEELSKSVWFHFGTEDTIDGLKASGKKIKATINSDGAFSYCIDKLKYNTVYRFVACAKVNDREVYGDVISFSTNNIQAQVSTGEVTSIGLFSATLSGQLDVENEESLSKIVWFFYGSDNTIDELKTNGEKVQTTIKDDGSFICDIAPLEIRTKYYYVACAKVHDKEIVGDIISFSTGDINARVTTERSSNVWVSRALLSGSLTIDNQEELSKSVWFLYSSSATSIEALKTSGNKTDATLSSNGEFNASLSGLNPASNYVFIACAKVHDKVIYGDMKSFTTRDLPEGAVDLGLAVSWASCNVGASKPEEFGDYYAWGETESHIQWFSPDSPYNVIWKNGMTGYYETTYKWKLDSDNYSKYNSLDNKITLDSSDDVASIKLGGKWRIPTREEWTELIENCSMSWGTENGVYGRYLTSKINANWIFLPAAGHWRGDTLYGNGPDKEGSYWTSSFYGSPDYLAWLYSSRASYSGIVYRVRYWGCSIRPVTD